MVADNQMTTSGRHPNARSIQRVADAWSLRVRGETWDSVAKSAGYANGSNALRAVRNYIGSLPEPPVPELRTLWRERLEYLWSVAVRDAQDGKSGAVRAAVAVAHRAAQIDGLDQPHRVEVSGGAAELDQMVRALLAARSDVASVEADMWEMSAVEA